MTLSEEKEDEMYRSSIETNMTLNTIKERLGKGDESLDNHEGRLISLEVDRKLLNGKLGWIVLGMSICFTAALHVVGWIVSHLWK